MHFEFEISNLLLKSHCTLPMKSNGNHKEIHGFELKIHLAPSSEGVRRSADMQTRRIFVGLNVSDISTGPEYFILLAS